MTGLLIFVAPQKAPLLDQMRNHFLSRSGLQIIGSNRDIVLPTRAPSGGQFWFEIKDAKSFNYPVFGGEYRSAPAVFEIEGSASDELVEFAANEISAFCKAFDLLVRTPDLDDVDYPEPTVGTAFNKEVLVGYILSNQVQLAQAAN